MRVCECPPTGDGEPPPTPGAAVVEEEDGVEETKEVTTNSLAFGSNLKFFIALQGKNEGMKHDRIEVWESDTVDWNWNRTYFSFSSPDPD